MDTLQPQLTVKGRGAAANPVNRFVPLHYTRDVDANDEEQPAPRTRFFHDQAR